MVAEGGFEKSQKMGCLGREALAVLGLGTLTRKVLALVRALSPGRWLGPLHQGQWPLRTAVPYSVVLGSIQQREFSSGEMLASTEG